MEKVDEMEILLVWEYIIEHSPVCYEDLIKKLPKSVHVVPILKARGVIKDTDLHYDKK